jgi:ribose transport system permease protein
MHLNNDNIVFSRIKTLMNKKDSGIIFAFVALFIILSFASDSFFHVENLLNVGRQVAIRGIMAIGLGLVVISGNIDLSIGSIYGLSAVVTAIILRDTRSTVLGIAGGLLIGLIFGIVNGLLVVKIGVPAFITTFGMMNVARGIALIITDSYPITLLVEGVDQMTHKFFYFIGQGLLFNIIPMQLIFMVIMMICFGYILHKTNFGIHMFAVGGSEKTSFVSGIKVGQIRMKTYIISGILAAFCGILSLSFMGSIIPTAGQGLEFEVFAAVVIGGTSMAGGEGSILGILFGILIFGIIQNGLILLGVGTFWQVLVIGLLTICAVVYDSLRSRGRLLKGV